MDFLRRFCSRSILLPLTSYLLLLFFGIVAIAAPQDNKTQKKPAPKAQPVSAVDDEDIPDSLLHPRWKIQKIAPLLVEDLDSSALDLKMPDNIRQTVEYDDSLNLYLIGSKIGDTYLNAPVVMTPEEYQKWSERRALHDFFRQKDAENVKTEGKDKFSFADMHFDLGPAEKIFGPGGVRIKTQGTAELKLGATMKNIDNPSLPIRNRKTTSFDFDEKINLNVNGKVGDKVNMNLNYNTDATFDFDTQNMKLKYDGKEDEIIKLVEGGNVSFPSNNSLVKGASSLFGIRTDMQFGKLKLQTVVSQKKSATKSVSAKGGTQTTPYGRNTDIEGFCNMPSIPEWKMHFMLKKVFEKLWKHPGRTVSRLCKLIDQCYTEDTTLPEIDTSEEARLSGEKEHIERRKANLLEMRLEGSIDGETYIRLNTEMTAQLEEICKKLEELGAEQSVKEPEKAEDADTKKAKTDAIKDVLRECADLSKKQLDDQMILCFVDRVVPHEDHSFDWYINLDTSDKDFEENEYIPYLTFKIGFEEAREYRKSLGNYLRSNQWSDLTVNIHLCI